MLREPLAPLIYYATTRRARADLLINGLGQQTAYSLWLLNEGSMRLLNNGSMGQSERSEPIRGEGYALTEPGQSVAITKGSSIRVICFDLQPRTVQWASKHQHSNVPLVDRSTPVQRPLRDVLGTTVTYPLPQHWGNSLNKLYSFINNHYWRSPLGMNKAAHALVSWLIHFYETDLNFEQDHRFARSPNDFIRSIMATVANNHLITVEELAQYYGMSRSYFTTEFTKAMGMSPGKMIEQERMRHARLSLSRGRKSVAYIANACGFKTTSAFSRAFKRYHDMTPKQYQKNHHALADQVFFISHND